MARWAKKRLPRVAVHLTRSFGQFFLPGDDATLGGMYLYWPVLGGSAFAGEFRVHSNGSLLLFSSTVPLTVVGSAADPLVVGTRIHTDDVLASRVLACQIRVLEELTKSPNEECAKMATIENPLLVGTIKKIQGWEYGPAE